MKQLRAPTKAVPYLRVSTDDKDQDPRRQLDSITTWAARNHVQLLEAVQDVGTSASKTEPMQRPAFLEALERAKAAGAGVVVDDVLRYTREGSEAFHVYRYRMRTEHRVQLLVADGELAQQHELGARLQRIFKAEAGAAWVETHSLATKAGMARAKRDGKLVSRPPRPPMTDDEFRVALDMLGQGRGHVKGLGLRAVADEISRRRGAYDVLDAKARRARQVGKDWVGEQLRARFLAHQNRLERASVGKGASAQQDREPAAKGPLSRRMSASKEPPP